MAWGDLNAITVTGDFTYPDGTGTPAIPTNGIVTFDFPADLLSIRDADSNLYIVPRRILGRMNNSGFLKLPDGTTPLVVPASDDTQVTPTDWSYQMTVTVTAAGVTTVEERDVILSTANGSTQDIADLITVTPTGGFTTSATEAEAIAIRARLDALEGAGAVVGGDISPTFSKAGPISVGPLHGPWPAPASFNIAFVLVALGTAPVGQPAIFDIQKNGTTIFTTSAHRPTVPSGSTLFQTVAPDITAVSAHDVLTASVVQPGLTTAGSDLTLLVVKA